MRVSKAMAKKLGVDAKPKLCGRRVSKETLLLDWPPSVDHYWRYGRGRVYVSESGVIYKQSVAIRAVKFLWSHVEGRLRVRLVAHPPDRGKHDLDNLLKAILDSLQYAGVYEDDSQIDSLMVDRGEVVAGGLIKVTVEQIAENR